MKARISLKARAVRLLSQREHSRQELIRKLRSHVTDESELERVLQELADQGWQSDARFAEALTRRDQVKHGIRRIEMTLRERGVDQALIEESLEALKDTEFERAYQVWYKRFGAAGLPQEPREYARQARFLASRGFGSDLVIRILEGQRPDAWDDYENFHADFGNL